MISLRNIVFATPDPPRLAQFYADLLGWMIIRRDWFVVARDEVTLPQLAFGDGPGDYIPPRWQDSEFPAQLHVDIAVSNLEEFDRRVWELGGRLLQDGDTSRVYADPDEHPFCSVQGEAGEPPMVSRVVIDCFSPRSLATFYEGLLGVARIEDRPDFVEIEAAAGSGPTLGFRHTVGPAPRWPDPRYPQQIHLDLNVEDGAGSVAAAERLGAIRLPPMGGSCPVMADPGGHPFCLCSTGE